MGKTCECGCMRPAANRFARGHGTRSSPVAFRVDPDTGCWDWQLNKTKFGYAHVCHDGKRTLAHRFYYELLVGPIPEGLTIDHLCRNRGCVNPRHLEPVTARENTLRGETISAKNAEKTHCVHGHEFTPENTYIRPGGAGRTCLACRRKAERRYYLTKRAPTVNVKR